MNGIIDVTVRLIRAAQRASTKKWSFFGVFAVVFFSSVIVLGQLDLLPDASPATVVSADSPVVSLSSTTDVNTQTPVAAELPLKVEIAKINLSTIISNPATADNTVLDKALLLGAV